MPFVFRPATERGRLLEPGLTGTAAFSHGSAFDRAWLGFHALRVLNRIELAAGVRLPPARRANMEILTLVLAGTYRATFRSTDFQESCTGPLQAGTWHRLGAGVGVEVVEENACPDTSLRLLQFWLQPSHSNTVPEQAAAIPLASEARIAAPLNALLPWGSTASVRRQRILPGGTLTLPNTLGGACWVEVLGGEVAQGKQVLRVGDGLGVASEAAIALVTSFGVDLLVIDLPG